eukprot:gene12301-15457_t
MDNANIREDLTPQLQILPEKSSMKQEQLERQLTPSEKENSGLPVFITCAVRSKAAAQGFVEGVMDDLQEEQSKELEDALSLIPSVDPDHAYDKNNILELAQLIMFYAEDYEGSGADRDSNILELAQLIMLYAEDYEGSGADTGRIFQCIESIYAGVDDDDDWDEDNKLALSALVRTALASSTWFTASQYDKLRKIWEGICLREGWGLPEAATES